MMRVDDHCLLPFRAIVFCQASRRMLSGFVRPQAFSHGPPVLLPATGRRACAVGTEYADVDLLAILLPVRVRGWSALLQAEGFGMARPTRAAARSARASTAPAAVAPAGRRHRPRHVGRDGDLYVRVGLESLKQLRNRVVHAEELAAVCFPIRSSSRCRRDDAPDLTSHPLWLLQPQYPRCRRPRSCL